MLLLMAELLCAQAGPYATPSIERFGLTDGLPHRSNYSAAYDQDSILWFATEGGICRYDGYRITSFPQFQQAFNGTMHRNESGLMYTINWLHQDSLDVLNPATLSTGGVNLSRGHSGAFAGAVHRDDEPLYFAQGAFVYRFHFGEDALMQHELGSEVGAGDLLVNASPSSYVIFRHQQDELEELLPDGTLLRTKLPVTGSKVSFHAARDGTIWIMTQQGLYRKPPQSSRLEAGPTLPTGNPVSHIFEDQSGNFILAYMHPTLLRIQGIIALLGDEEISLQWLQDYEDRIINISGTNFLEEINVSTHGGFVRVNFPESRPSPFRKYLYDREVEPGGFGNIMRGFTADDEGNVYTNKDTRQPYWFRVNEDTQSLDTLTMQDGKGNVVDNFGCGTNMLNYRGDILGSSCTLAEADTAHVYRYRPADGSWKRWALPEVNERIRWMMLVPGSDDVLLVTEGREEKINKGALYYFNPESGAFRAIQLNGPEYFIADYTKHGVQDTLNNVIWFGALSGLYRFDPKAESLHRYKEEISRNSQISHIHVRPDSTLLLGTFKQGLLRFFPNEERFLRVGGTLSDEDPSTQSNDFLPLPSNDIASLAVSPDQHLIITTFNGLSVHGISDEPATVFTVDDGLPSNEFNTPSLFYNQHDSLWYAGGINGFISFRVKDLTPSRSPFHPVILRTRYLDEDAGYEQTKQIITNHDHPLVIPPSVSYFSLEYVIPDYSNRRPLLYQTMLVNHDNRWRNPTETPSVRYTRLPPGEYHFHLKAIDGAGRHTFEAKKLTIIVQRPWYKTSWFYALCLLSTALFMASYLLTRDKRLRQEYRAKRQLQELELRALRQQINPHFISNAMNAIRDFIYLESKDEAAGYLTDFTRLMRLFLESSRGRFTSVSDEKDLLDRYIRLEQLRYPGKFTYAINIHPDIQEDMDEVPSLLLQPIVENAINHGLGHLSENGLLTVDFALASDDEETIICTVTDNGVGRKKAALLKTASSDHVSRATQILEDRQQLLQADGIIEISIDTQDAFPGEENPGTKVTVRIEPAEKKV